MNMRYLIAFAVLACSLPAASVGDSRPVPVSLIQLIAAPEKFDGKVVAVQGFLVLGEHPEFIGQFPMLYVHQEDARNLLSNNSLYVAPSDQMRREREKIDQMYVTLIGVFRAANSPSGLPPGMGTIADVQSCQPWSDPARPIGDKKSKAQPKYR